MSLQKIIEKTFGIKSPKKSWPRLILKLERLEKQTEERTLYLEKKLDETYISFKDVIVSGKSKEVQMSFAAQYYKLNESYAATKATKSYLAGILCAYSMLEKQRKIIELGKRIAESADEPNKTRCVVKAVQSPSNNKAIEQLAMYFESDREYAAGVKKTYEMLCARVDAELRSE